MNSPSARHYWAAASTTGARRPAPGAQLEVRCHRRLRGPYTGGGALLRQVVPELAEHQPALVTARATEVLAIAPDLLPLVPDAPQTLTSIAEGAERTRFYSADRTGRLAHGIAELLTDWARRLHPEGVVVAFRELAQADPTDRELVAVLLRRCDPRVLTLVVEIDAVEQDGSVGDALEAALTGYADRVAPAVRLRSALPPGADPAQLFVDSDGTAADPELRRAYEALPADERARRHTDRAAELTARNEPGVRLGALPYHLEHGTDPAGAGAGACVRAADACFDLGCYEAAMDLGLRARLLFGDERPKEYWTVTHRIGACLSYLGRGEAAFDYFAELRAGSTEPAVHMNACYMVAMLHTRHLPKHLQDHDTALAWINTAIAIADSEADPHRRTFAGAFMRNGRALVDMHRGDLDGALALVERGIAMTDADLGPDEQLLHRSVLLFNRAQILAAQGDHAAALRDYDVLISRDPDYGDYYFERAAERRADNRYAEALADYAEAIRLNPAFHEAHCNRADFLRELGEEEGALRDLDRALELEPDHLDSLVNRADVLMALDRGERAAADVAAGLALDPVNVHLLTARGSLSAEAGDTEAAEADFAAALRTDPGFVAAWANRAVLRYSAGRLAEALDDLDRAIALGDDVVLRANRALALQDLGDHDRALADLDLAVPALGEQSPDLFHRRGLSRHLLGDLEGARSDWRAHLTGYGSGEASPFRAQIERYAADLLAGCEAPGGAPGR